MTGWYKMDPVAWNHGTEKLTLEQEAALLRICNAIHLSEGPLPNNKFVIAGLLRCNERKARRIVDELLAAGKVVLEGDKISNPRAEHDVSERIQRRVGYQSAGHRGGVESGKARAKPLVSNEPGQAIASLSREPDKIRREESSVLPRTRFANPAIILQSVVDPMTAKAFTKHCEQKRKALSAETAEALVGVLREVKAAGGNPTRAVQLAIRKGWVSFEIEWLRKAGMEFGLANHDLAESVRSWPAETWQPILDHYRASGDWNKLALGPSPGEPGCLAPSDLLVGVT